MRLVFMGTPDFSVPVLDAMVEAGHEVAAVYTQPPRPKGRGQQVQPSPVHLVAECNKIPVYTPKSLKKDESAQMMFAAHHADVAVVAAYGLILPKAVLDSPKYGCLNIHASLLPRWRGASPIQHAIWKGDEKSGISIMQMDEGLDTGAVIDMREVAIRPVTTAQSLHDELAALGGAMIVDAIEKLSAEGKLLSAPQDDAKSTYAPMLKKEDGKVNWAQSAHEIDCQIRALNPWPGVWTETASGARFKILAAEVHDEIFTDAPGTLVDRAGHVSCGGDTVLKILKIQPDNAKAMDVASAINGGYLRVDEKFF